MRCWWSGASKIMALGAARDRSLDLGGAMGTRLCSEARARCLSAVVRSRRGAR